MSAGIRCRSKRCRAYWQRHLELSRKFIRSATVDSSSAIVYGAGGLLDIDCRALDTTMTSLTLVDIDPTLKSQWLKSFPKLCEAKSLNCQILDVTGVMDSWLSALGLARRDKISIEEMVLVFNRLKVGSPSSTLLDRECAVSLNLFGQLGVYWRDRAIGALSADSYYFATDGVLLPALDAALQQSVNRLELSHLELLSNFKKVILLTDVFYHYYKESDSLWQTEEALTISSEDINEFFRSRGYRLRNSDSWLWHIAPQKIENPDYGEIHEVRAFNFEK